MTRSLPGFLVWNVLHLSALSQQFDNVLDSGLFHVPATTTAACSSTTSARRFRPAAATSCCRSATECGRLD
jgi:hypothetical protein